MNVSEAGIKGLHRMSDVMPTPPTHTTMQLHYDGVVTIGKNKQNKQLAR